MSVFGGDSWGREAQQRKRRVEDLVAEEAIDESSSVKKLSNGKFACLVCPHNPVLDSLLMFSVCFRFVFFLFYSVSYISHSFLILTISLPQTQKYLILDGTLNTWCLYPKMTSRERPRKGFIFYLR